MRRSLAGLGLAAVLILAFVVQGGTFAQSATRTSTLGMRPSGGFLSLDRLQKYEGILDTRISWYVGFADRDGPEQMRSSVFGQMKAKDAALPKLSDRLNLVMTVPLAFGRATTRTEQGRAQIADNLRKTASGVNDEHYRVVAQNLVDGGYGDAVIRLGHESTGSWVPWSAAYAPDLYRAAFRHIHDVMTAVSPSFRFEWNVARADFTELGIPAYPGDDVVDIMGMDIYHRPAKTGRMLDDRLWERRYERALVAHRDFAIARGKPVAYSEWAVGTAEDPGFIDLMAAWFRSLPARGGGSLAYQIYWNTNEDRFNLDLYPRNRAALIRNFGSPSAAAAAGATEAQLVPATTAVPGPPTTEAGSTLPGDAPTTTAATVPVDTAPSDGSTTVPPAEPGPAPSAPPGTDGSAWSPEVDVRPGQKQEGTGADASVGVRVVLSEPTDRDVTVTLMATSDSATDGSDFYGRTGDVVIPAGETVAWFGVTLIGDADPEPDETVKVVIVSADGATPARGSGLMTIVNDD